MEIRNNNQTFGAKLGWSAKYHLKKNPEMLEQISNRIAGFGEPTTVVEIMSTNTKKGKLYSLRIYNEIFGTGDNVSILKDNQNKDVVSYFAQDFINALANLSEKTIAFREYSLFSKIKNAYSASPLHVKSLFEHLKLAEAEGKHLSEKTKKDFFSGF